MPKLLNIDFTHPGAREILFKGAMSIRRTSKSFSRSAIDLTLEQTINANIASRETGIVAFNMSEDARHRWMLTQSVRSAVIANLYEMAGMKKTEDCSPDIAPYRIKCDNEDKQKIIKQIEETMNPLKGSSSDANLYCITIGKAASESVKVDLLGCKTFGHQRCEDFKTESFQDPNRFERPLSRSKLKNFASDGTKVRLSGKDKKVREIPCSRDIFGRLLYLAIMNDNFELKLVFEFPLIPVPLSLAHVDGTRHTTTKSSAITNLKAEFKVRPLIKLMLQQLMQCLF